MRKNGKLRSEKNVTSHYIYEINTLCGSLAGKYYIGKRTTKGDPFTESYAGSGKIIQDYYKKYGKIEGVTYEKVIIEFNSSKNKNAQRESEIIGDAWKNDSRCINLEAGGGGTGNHNPQNNGLAKPVYQYSLNGDFIKEWESGAVAAKALNIDRSSIYACCRGDKYKTAGGFVWRYSPVQIDIKKIKDRYKTAAKAVNQYKDDTFIRSYESMTEAERITGIDRSTISLCINGITKTAGGYKWKTTY